MVSTIPADFEMMKPYFNQQLMFEWKKWNDPDHATKEVPEWSQW
jgi:hypothetical protein